MSEEKRSDLERTEELFQFLQGNIPDGYRIKRQNQPKLTADQAWTVIWYLGNQYWEVSDRIERCGVCGDLYNSHSEGYCLDFGKPPYHFCDSCEYTEAYIKKKRSRANPENKKASK